MNTDGASEWWGLRLCIFLTIPAVNFPNLAVPTPLHEARYNLSTVYSTYFFGEVH